MITATLDEIVTYVQIVNSCESIAICMPLFWRIPNLYGSSNLLVMLRRSDRLLRNRERARDTILAGTRCVFQAERKCTARGPGEGYKRGRRSHSARDWS